jgi:hypothetical protein
MLWRKAVPLGRGARGVWASTFSGRARSGLRGAADGWSQSWTFANSVVVSIFSQARPSVVAAPNVILRCRLRPSGNQFGDQAAGDAFNGSGLFCS